MFVFLTLIQHLKEFTRQNILAYQVTCVLQTDGRPFLETLKISQPRNMAIRLRIITITTLIARPETVI